MSRARRQRCRARLERLAARLFPEVLPEGHPTQEGHEAVVIHSEAQKRLNKGFVWRLEGELKSVGVTVTPEILAIISDVVARGISSRHQVLQRPRPRDLKPEEENPC